MRGVLVTFEGVEGSGKSTQAELLVGELRRRGIACEFSREPGGTEIGEQIRRVLLDPAHRIMEPWTELFLYLASRNQCVREHVLPWLQAGKVVVFDRFAESSVAYQGAGRGLGETVVARLNKTATTGIKPDLTILVDVPVSVGRERKAAIELDRLEQEEVEFHERVRNSYLRMARRAPKRIKVLDGTQPAQKLAAQVLRPVEGLLSRKGLLY